MVSDVSVVVCSLDERGNMFGLGPVYVSEGDRWKIVGKDFLVYFHHCNGNRSSGR